MRVLGIDCGGAYTGYGVVDIDSHGRLCCLTCGAIKLSPREALPRRLSRIFTQLGDIIAEHHPDQVAIEDVFYALNVKSALKLGQVRGVAMLAAAAAGLEVAEYSPLTIKSSVVGYGRAEKQQVQHMVTRLLDLPSPPEPMDASDALAIAICHLHTAGTLAKQRVAKVVDSAKP
jgi:crossover junction endodeoxyribonuclease RuvC